MERKQTVYVTPVDWARHSIGEAELDRELPSARPCPLERLRRVRFLAPEDYGRLTGHATDAPVLAAEAPPDLVPEAGAGAQVLLLDEANTPAVMAFLRELAHLPAEDQATRLAAWLRAG